MILVTGGAGYIGSHVTLGLISEGHDVVIFDNLENGHMSTVESLKSIKSLGHLYFHHGDLKNSNDVLSVFSSYSIDCVMHFAAYIQVEESVKNPSKYYENNVVGTLNLISEMVRSNVNKIVFSSTAAVYGEPIYTPIDEKHRLFPINPYGMSKFIIEKILNDFDVAYGLKSVSLRYFNVAGADEKCRIGERHIPETHLIPNILRSIGNDNCAFNMCGDDFDTKDGTCVRDYVNVEDLSDAHILALKYLENENKTDYFNLGTEKGYSIKEILDECEKTTNKKINVRVTNRRDGDPAVLIANSSKAKNILGWCPKRTLEDSITSAYNWMCKLGF